MKMKRVIVAATTLLLSVCTNAQNAVGCWSLQPRVGINLATMTNDDDAKTRIGLVAGAELEYQASPLLSVSAGALYSQQESTQIYPPLISQSLWAYPMNLAMLCWMHVIT